MLTMRSSPSLIFDINEETDNLRLHIEHQYLHKTAKKFSSRRPSFTENRIAVLTKLLVYQISNSIIVKYQRLNYLNLKQLTILERLLGMPYEWKEERFYEGGSH